jgi:hypothetical protein
MGNVAHVSKRLNHRAIRAYVEAEIDGCDQCRAANADCFVSDILDSLTVPRKYHRYTCKRLCCPRCEAGLYQNSWVMRCDAEERRYRQFVAHCSVKYGPQLRDFEHHLSRFPSLGMQHRLGKSIWRAISRFPAKTMRLERFIRVRRFDVGSELAQIKREGMGAPDPMICHISGGRYNHEGQSFLYLSSDEATGIVETFDRPDSERPLTGTCAIQEFEVRNLDRVLDLTQRDHASLLYSALVHEGTLSREIIHSSSWKPEYLVSRFVADVARAKGFNAMLYQTSKVYYAQGLNLVVFEPKTGGILETGDLTIWERVARGVETGLGFDVWYEVVRRDDLTAGGSLSGA